MENAEDVEIEALSSFSVKRQSNNRIFVATLFIGLIFSIFSFFTFEKYSSFRAMQWIFGLLSIFFYMVTYWSDIKALNSLSFTLMIFCSSSLVFSIIIALIFS